MDYFLLCSVTDGDGKRYRLFIPKGKGLVEGWELLAEKLKGLGVNGIQIKSWRRRAQGGEQKR